MSPPRRTPEPGIYGRDQIVYAEIPAINQSLLKHIGKSPLHYAHARDNPGRKATVPMRLGSVAHCAVLEPHRLDLDFQVFVPEAGKSHDFRGKAYTEQLATADAHGRELIKLAELERANRMRLAVHTNKLARRYLAKYLAEPILVWVDQETGMLCKARLDAVSLSVPDVMCELKTAADINPWTFSGQFGKLGYHIQCAFYADGYKAITGRELYGKCIAVESADPFDVIVFDLAEVVDAGREDYRALMAKLAECEKLAQWPGQAPDAEVTLELPKWLTDDDGDSTALEGLEGWRDDA